MLRIPSIIATLATSKAIEDLRVFLASLAIFNRNPPIVYIYCDSHIELLLKEITYDGTIVCNPVLDKYSQYNRQQMEKMPGVYFKSLWFDFMAEKINLIRWVFDTEEKARTDGVMFCDADICFMGPLPMIRANAILALSPHMIQESDTKKYGYYNGGYLWMLHPELADVWWEACKTARFYEQSALEDLAKAVDLEKLYEFPVTENYGWWRLWQGKKDSKTLSAEWGMNRKMGGSGIIIGDAIVGSVHTHFYEKNDMATMSFNDFVKYFLVKLSNSHEPARKLLNALK
jgi:hypothetical protein